MPAPAYASTISLTTIRDDLVFTRSRLLADERVAAEARVIAILLTTWEEVSRAQNALWDAQTHADALVAASDDALDDFLVGFANAARALPGGEKSATWRLYFKVAPSKLAAPVLGAQLETMRGWLAHLAKEKAPALAAMRKQLAAKVEAADAAVKARADANTANEAFRTRGDLAQYLTTVGKKRDGVAAAIDQIASDDAAMPSDYASRFFRHRAVKRSVEEREAKAAKREADRKAKADAKAAVAAAQARVKAALAELRDAKKK